MISTIRTFFDTNILFYSIDQRSPEKQVIARNLIELHGNSGTGCISVQILGEFFHATVHRQKILRAETADQIIQRFSAMQVLEIDYPMVRQAVANHQRFQTSYWDGLMLAAAQRASCSVVYSEDLNSGQDYGGVRVENPFLN